jgi:predicted HAD superfamily phosphohydrolase
VTGEDKVASALRWIDAPATRPYTVVRMLMLAFGERKIAVNSDVFAANEYRIKRAHGDVSAPNARVAAALVAAWEQGRSEALKTANSNSNRKGT